MNTTLMMQLVDEGKIALEDPVLKHLPELRLRDMQALKRITCAMLVNHTSGINCDWLPEYGPDQERIVDSINRCADLEQLHAPGEATSYNNMATVIAGYLTQKMRGESWYTLVKKRIYEPLGMRHALVDPIHRRAAWQLWSAAASGGAPTGVIETAGRFLTGRATNS